ncbi:hypothetical protein GOODEAATRI_023195 [Goodea atripinnis]|uniref:Uncharacterized protein n=1 Tax=Goodea atripinnis TaxID=208336 RepID=A0ABV0MK35_9TELE
MSVNKSLILPQQYSYVFHFVLQVSGVALITIGALQYSTYSQIGTFAGSGLSKIAIVLIAVGITIALVSLLGHLGAFLNKSSIVAGVCTECPQIGLRLCPLNVTKV